MHLALLFLSLLQTPTHDTIWIEPATPQPGAQVTVHYTTDDPAWAKKRALAGALYSLDKKSTIHALDLAYRREGNGWVATGSVPDTAAAIAVNVFSDAGTPVKAIASGLYGSDGQPLRDGYKALASAYTSMGHYYFGIATDNDKAAALRNQYWASAKEPPTAFNDKIAYYLEYKKDTAKLLKEFAALPLDTSATEGNYNQAAYLAGRLKNKPLSEILTNLMHQKYPAGDWKKMDFYRRASTATDVEEKKQILADYQKTYPNEPKPAANMITIGDVLQQGIASAYAVKGDIKDAVGSIPASSTGLERAGAYNNIAWEAAKKDLSIPDATALSKTSLDTVAAYQASGAGKPDNLSTPQYKKNLKETYAMYADTYAFLLYKSGDYSKAFAFEKVALGNGDVEKDIIDRYHMMMEKVEKPSKVVASLSTYIAKGNADSTMEAQYKRLYTGSGSADDALAALEARAKAARQAEMIKTILNEPASHFVLRDLKGNRVSLDSLRGKTVVLDFWATWCGPCKASFPAMQQLVDKHKADNNVVLLFIDTWENVDDKNKNATDFAAANPYTFHILMDNDNEVVGRYKVEGIPTKFVIDPNGTLRFKAVGFNGDTKATVDEMEGMIQLASKP